MQALKKYRERKGVKQCAVARQLGISRQTYSKLENNQEDMSIQQAKAVCDFLGCKVDDIFLNFKVK